MERGGPDVVRLVERAAAYTQDVTAPARHLARSPERLSDVGAVAADRRSYSVASARRPADVGPGHRVLVHGAAGGIGHLAVRIANARGARVIGTARAALADRGALRVNVARTFPLVEAARAHELGEAGSIRGKLVLTVD